MPPKKRQRTSNDMQTTYYLPNSQIPNTAPSIQTPVQQHQSQLNTQQSSQQSQPSHQYPIYYPPDPHRYYNYNYGVNSQPPPPQATQLQAASHTFPSPQLQQHQQHQQDENDIARGALLLNNLKDVMVDANNGDNLDNDSGKVKRPSLTSNSVNGGSNNVSMKKSKKTFQRVFIHRVNMNLSNDELNKQINSKLSNIRDTSDNDGNDKENKEIDEKDEIIPNMEELGTPNTKHSSADIIFANGNNREKRRVEMFENYSELYKFKERNRDALYKIQRKEILDRLSLLNTPSNPNTEHSNSEDLEFFEDETDLIEKRDFELTRLKNWRRYRRNKNIKDYYNNSNQLYKFTNEVLVEKLEKLKQFFIKQRNLLNNLDREYTDINSNRAEKFYTGATNKSHTLQQQQQQQQISRSTEIDSHESDHDHLLISQKDNDHTDQTQDSSETDTGFTSSNARRRAVPNRFGRRGKPKGSTTASKRQKSNGSNTLNNTLMSSILEGFAPILTHDEFEHITNDENVRGSNSSSNGGSGSGSGGVSSYKISASGTSPMNSDTEGVKTDHGNGTGNSTINNGGNTGRTTTSSRAVREARDREGYGRDNNTATLNKIMKQYISPDNLTIDEVEEDLKLLKSKTHK